MKKGSCIKFYLLFLVVLQLSFSTVCMNVYADSSSGIAIVSSSQNVTNWTKSALECTKDNGIGDQAICDDQVKGKKTFCEMVPSNGKFYCVPQGESYCFENSDCHSLGKNSCVINYGSVVAYLSGDGDPTSIGICSSASGDSENNAFGQTMCNLINVVTGNAGRLFMGAVMIVTGIMFVFGKVTWGFVVAIFLGAGSMFGAKDVVGIITGKPYYCNAG